MHVKKALRIKRSINNNSAFLTVQFFCHWQVITWRNKAKKNVLGTVHECESSASERLFSCCDFIVKSKQELKCIETFDRCGRRNELFSDLLLIPDWQQVLLDELQYGVQPHPKTEGLSWDVLLEEETTHAKNYNEHLAFKHDIVWNGKKYECTEHSFSLATRWHNHLPDETPW